MTSIRPLTPLERRLLAAVERIELEGREREAGLRAEMAALRAEMETTRTEIAAARAETMGFARSVTALSGVLDYAMGEASPGMEPSLQAGPSLGTDPSQ